MRKHIIRDFSHQGDTVVAEWTPGVKKEEKTAAKIFTEIMASGKTLHAPDPTWAKTKQVFEFDPQIEEYQVLRPIIGG